MMNEDILRKLKGARAKLYRVFKPSKRTLRQVGYRGADFVVFANEDVGWRLITRKTYEEPELNSMERLMRDDDVCVDVGANVGIFSIFMARKAPRGRVLAFEPFALSRALVSLNAALNGIENIEIRAEAVSSSSGTVSFSISSDSAYSSIRPTGRRGDASATMVKAVTLDEVLAAAGKPAGIVKIDVEGAELKVLEGASRTLVEPAFRPRAILVELCEKNSVHYGYGPIDVVSFMEARGYSVWSIRNGELIEDWSPGTRSENVFFLTEKPT